MFFAFIWAASCRYQSKNNANAVRSSKADPTVLIQNEDNPTISFSSDSNYQISFCTFHDISRAGIVMDGGSAYYSTYHTVNVISTSFSHCASSDDEAGAIYISWACVTTLRRICANSVSHHKEHGLFYLSLAGTEQHINEITAVNVTSPTRPLYIYSRAFYHSTNGYVEFNNNNFTNCRATNNNDDGLVYSNYCNILMWYNQYERNSIGYSLLTFLDTPNVEISGDNIYHSNFINNVQKEGSTLKGYITLLSYKFKIDDCVFLHDVAPEIFFFADYSATLKVTNSYSDHDFSFSGKVQALSDIVTKTSPYDFHLFITDVCQLPEVESSSEESEIESDESESSIEESVEISSEIEESSSESSEIPSSSQTSESYSSEEFSSETSESSETTSSETTEISSSESSESTSSESSESPSTESTESSSETSESSSTETSQTSESSSSQTSESSTSETSEVSSSSEIIVSSSSEESSKQTSESETFSTETSSSSTGGDSQDQGGVSPQTKTTIISVAVILAVLIIVVIIVVIVVLRKRSEAEFSHLTTSLRESIDDHYDGNA